MSIETMKLALEALEETKPHFAKHRKLEAITALRQAIEQAQKQEPVGRFSKFTDGVWKEVTATSAGQPLYAAPPQRQWVGLTWEEIDECFKITPNQYLSAHIYKRIETKLKQKNGYTEEENK